MATMFTGHADPTLVHVDSTDASTDIATRAPAPKSTNTSLNKNPNQRSKVRRLPKPLPAPSLTSVVSAAANATTASSLWLSHLWLSAELSETQGPLTSINIGTSLVIVSCLSGMPVVVMTFKHAITCHDINLHTADMHSGHLDVLIGFASGECIWYNPLLNTYLRFNKSGRFNSISALTQIKWCPQSSSNFMMAFSDGTLLMMDVLRLDVKSKSTSSAANKSPSKQQNSGSQHLIPSSDEDTLADSVASSTTTPEPVSHNTIMADGRIRILESNIKGRKKRYNPVYALRVAPANVFLSRQSASESSTSPPQPVNKTSPILTDACMASLISEMGDATLGLAVTLSTGSLYVLNASSHKDLPTLTDVYPSMYGAFLCVDWSPCGRWIVVGGQDDCVYLYSVEKRDLIAKLEGHVSWVTSVTFQRSDVFIGAVPEEEEEDLNICKLASVGEDCRMCLWEIPVDAAPMMQLQSQSSRHSKTSRTSMMIRSISQSTFNNTGRLQLQVHESPHLVSPPVYNPQVVGKAHWMPCSAVVYGYGLAVSACRLGEMRLWEE